MQRGAPVDDVAGELVVAATAKLHEPARDVIKRAALEGSCTYESCVGLPGEQFSKRSVGRTCRPVCGREKIAFKVTTSERGKSHNRKRKPKNRTLTATELN